MCWTRDLNGETEPSQIPPTTNFCDLKIKMLLDILLHLFTCPRAASFWRLLKRLKELLLPLIIQCRFRHIELPLIHNGLWAFSIVVVDECTDRGASEASYLNNIFDGFAFAS